MARKKVKVRKKRTKVPSKLNEMAWDMARIMTRHRPDKKYVNKKTFCPTCELYGCLGFDNVFQWCTECPYNFCPKDLEFTKICKECGRIK